MTLLDQIIYFNVIATAISYIAFVVWSIITTTSVEGISQLRDRYYLGDLLIACIFLAVIWPVTLYCIAYIYIKEK